LIDLLLETVERIEQEHNMLPQLTYAQESFAVLDSATEDSGVLEARFKKDS